MKIKIAIAGAALVLLTSGFFGLDYVIAANGHCHDLTLAIDRAIPLCPAWIWVYLLYYPMCCLPLAFPGVLKDNRLFAAVGVGMLIQFVIAWPTFYFFPTHIQHAWVAPTMPSGLALRGLYLTDPGYNDFPCLHVANSLYVAFLSTSYCAPWVSGLLFLTALFIAASTLLIKQHFFLDVLSGSLLGYFGYVVARAMSAKPLRARQFVLGRWPKVEPAAEPVGLSVAMEASSSQRPSYR